MYKDNKFFLMAVCVIFLMAFVPLISGAKVTTAITSSEGYILEVNVVDYISQGSDHLFGLHVFNKSNGMPINSDIICYMHLYYDGFGETYTGSTINTVGLFDYQFNLTGGNFSQRGQYVAKFQCNSTDLGGGQETFFTVNSYGQELTDALSNNFNWSMMFMMILFVLALIGAFSIENYIAKFALYWVCHLLFIVGTFSMWQFNAGYEVSFLAFAGFWKVLFYVSISAVLPMIILSGAWIFYIHTFNEHVEKLIDKGMDTESAFTMAKKKSGGWFSGK